MPDVPEVKVQTTINGRAYKATVEPRLTLADFIREECGLTGTHLGCEHGVCGACTIIVDGEAVRSCLMFAVQADGTEITTIEGMGTPEGGLSEVQEAFRDCHGLQCGFCTPGFVVSVTAFLKDNPKPTDTEIREGLSGNLCRCTGYQGIVNAVRQASGQAKPASSRPLTRLRHRRRRVSRPRPGPARQIHRVSSDATSLPAAIARRAATEPDRVVLVHVAADGTERSFTWAELDRRSSQLAGALAERGLGYGDRLGIALANTPHFVLAGFAAWKLGAVPVPMRWDLPDWELERLQQTVAGAVHLGVDDIAWIDAHRRP